MLKKMKLTSLCLVIAAGSLGVLRAADAPTAAPAPASPVLKTAGLFDDPVVAKGNGIEIKRSQVDEEVIRVKAQLAARGQTLPPEHTAMIAPGVLDQLIQVQLLKSKSTDADRAAAKEKALKQLEEAKTQMGSEEALNLRLKAQGLTRDEVIAKWTDVETAKACLTRELKINVSDEDVKKFYDENPQHFEEPEMVRASHILISTKDASDPEQNPSMKKDLSDEQKTAKKKQAEDLLKRARAGEDFGKLAKEFSEDPGSKDKGGEYTFPRGQMVPAFEAAAFALKTNQVSDIVTTPFGYHIIKLSEKIPAKKQSLTEVSPRIKDYLAQQSIQKQAPDFLEKLRKDADVKILDDELKLKTVAPTNDLPAGHPPVKSEAKVEAK